MQTKKLITFFLVQTSKSKVTQDI